MEHTQQRVVHANVVFGNKSEHELICKAKGGDKQAFRTLYDDHIVRKQKGWVQRMFNLENSGINEMPAEENSTDVDLEALIIRLPERARMVFVLHALEGYRHEDIAKMLNMAVGSSKAQFFRAKQLLKEFMGVDDE